ncbi:hypothetical protein WN51_12675 [Melipona quadrifasciata]|uniref:Uncharacterized protein n=1 Tax=Melipona quadrifasciata TaxID=166423 RepID=A0A0N0BGS8_9HYME|nr:hypothetical protein WN51_12675 [Melipona quadrifasciata]
MDQNGQYNLLNKFEEFVISKSFILFAWKRKTARTCQSQEKSSFTQWGNKPEEIFDIAAAACERGRRRQRLGRSGRCTDAGRSNSGDAVPLNWPGVRLMTHLAGAGRSRCCVQPAEFNSLQVNHQVGEFLGNLATLFLRLVVDRGVGL